MAIEEPDTASLSGTGPLTRPASKTTRSEYAPTPATTRKPAIDSNPAHRAVHLRQIGPGADRTNHVGVDALDSLESSNDVKVFTFQTRLAYMVPPNVQKPYLRDPDSRNQFQRCVSWCSGGRGAEGPRERRLSVPCGPIIGPTRPILLPQFHYDPRPVALGRLAPPDLHLQRTGIRRAGQKPFKDSCRRLASTSRRPCQRRSAGRATEKRRFRCITDFFRDRTWFGRIWSGTPGPFNYGHSSSAPGEHGAGHTTADDKILPGGRRRLRGCNG